MTVYIDVLICVNIFINFFLLICLKKFMSINVKLQRIIISAVVSSLLSLIIFLPEPALILNILIKILSACLVILVAFKFVNFKIFMQRICAFILTNISFCGLMMLFYQLFKPNKMIIYNDIVYFDISPVFLIIATLVCYFVMLFIQRLTGRSEVKSTLVNVSFAIQNKIYSCVGKIDTGCTLKEPFSSAPVIVVDRKILGNNFIIDDKNIRIIPFDTINGKGMLKSFAPEWVSINCNKIEKMIYIAISENKFNSNFEALLNMEVLQ